VAADELRRRTADLTGAVWVRLEGPAQLVQQDVMVPVAVVLEVREAGAAAVHPVLHVAGFTRADGLVAAAQ